jgi:hypothetical protein
VNANLRRVPSKTSEKLHGEDGKNPGNPVSMGLHDPACTDRKTKALIAGFAKLDRGPINDANEMLQALVTVGFNRSDVTVDYDLNFTEFMATLNDFKNTELVNDFETPAGII